MRYHKHGYSSAFIDVWLNVAPVAPVVSSPVSVAAVSYVTLISTIGRVELVSIGSNLIILPFFISQISCLSHLPPSTSNSPSTSSMVDSISDGLAAPAEIESTIGRVELVSIGSNLIILPSEEAT
jgi:virulence-associated protein VagC